MSTLRVKERQLQTKKQEVVAYVRSTEQYGCDIQSALIRKFCRHIGLSPPEVYADVGVNKRKAGEISYATELGLTISRHRCTHPEFEKMLLDIYAGKIAVIVTDVAFRITGFQPENMALEKACKEMGTKIVTVSDEMMSDGDLSNISLIYHFTNRSENRPSIVCSHIDQIYGFARSIGIADPIPIVDNSLKRSERKSWDWIIENMSRVRTILVESFYHLETKTVAWCSLMLGYSSYIRFISRKEGQCYVFEEDQLAGKLKVAIYSRKKNEYGAISELVVPRVQSFLKHKAPDCTVTGTYIESGMSSTKELMRMIAERDNFDLIITDNLNEINENTHSFMKIWEKLAYKPIYTFEKGGFSIGQPKESCVL